MFAYQRGIYVWQGEQLVVHAVDLLVLEAALLEVRVGEVEQRIAVEYTVDGALQYVGAFVCKDFSCLHILQKEGFEKCLIDLYVISRCVLVILYSLSGLGRDGYGRVKRVRPVPRAMRQVRASEEVNISGCHVPLYPRGDTSQVATTRDRILILLALIYKFLFATLRQIAAAVDIGLCVFEYDYARLSR